MGSGLPKQRSGPVLDHDGAPAGVDQLRQALQEGRHAGLIFRIIRGRGHQHADAPHPLAVLRVQ